jgi:hypothetical protein
MRHQGQHGEEEGSSDEEVAGSGTAVVDTCSKYELNSSKDTYTTIKTSSARASSNMASITNASASHFSFTKYDYNRKPRQSYYRNSNPCRYGARNHNNRSSWQAGSRGSYRPSYQPGIGSNSTEEEEVAVAYNEEEETQMYQPHSGPIQEIDPEVTLARICNWLGNILRKPDLARKLAGARLELGVDSDGKNRATFWLPGDAVEPRSFSLEYKSLLRMAFSTQVKRGYKLQIRSGEVVVPIE